MILQAKTGAIQSSPSAITDLRSDRTGALVSTQGSPKFQEAVLQGNVFIGANLGGAPVTTQAGLSATTPALTLYNPKGSGKRLVLWTVTVDITSSPAAASGLMLAWNLASAEAPSSTTDATITSAILGPLVKPVGQCYRVATLPAAPVAFRFLGGTTGASAISGVQLIDHIDGEVILDQGVAISIQATAAAAILASFTWSEIPL